MKRCSRCGESKGLDQFHVRKASRDGRQSLCKPCNSEQRKEHYRTAHGRERKEVTGKRYRAHARQFILDHLAAHPCVDCGEADPVVLEFDHRDEATKAFNIADGIRSGYSKQRLADEIAKCDVRCANCHRRRTAVQFGWPVRLNGIEPLTVRV